MPCEAVLLWLRAFALTQILEVPIYRRTLSAGFWEAFAASAITHPIVWWVNASGVWQSPWGFRALVSELFAWSVEAAYFRLVCRRPGAGLASLLANATSFAFGVLYPRIFF